MHYRSIDSCRASLWIGEESDSTTKHVRLGTCLVDRRACADLASSEQLLRRSRWPSQPSSSNHRPFSSHLQTLYLYSVFAINLIYTNDLTGDELRIEQESLG